MSVEPNTTTSASDSPYQIGDPWPPSYVGDPIPPVDYGPAWIHGAPITVDPSARERFTMHRCERCVHTNGHEPQPVGTGCPPCRLCGGSKVVLIDQVSGVVKKIPLGD